jgi:acetyl esterase/lipase
MKEESRVARVGLAAGALALALLPGATLSGVGFAASAIPSTVPAPVEIWPGAAPGAKGSSVEDKPALLVFLPEKSARSAAGVLVIPGGGFTRRCEDHEGVLVAQWLKARGIAAFVLRYRVQPIGTVRDALADAHRGMRYVRAHAAEWGIAPDRLGALGFSAGATLASGLGLEPLAARADAADPLERLSSRPDFMVIAYGDARQGNPGLRGLAAQGLSAEDAARTFAPSPEQIAAAPPTFLFGTTEDAGLTRSMADLYGRLIAARRPAEAHFFGFGEHGAGFARGDPLLGEWPSLLVSWMRTSGFLSDRSRVAVRGRVTLDGAPLPRGSVVLTPLGSSSAPVVVAYVYGTTEAAGEFAVPAERGPTPGRYLVEVRQDATRWASNARDAVLRRMQEKVRAGATLDAADMAEWTTSARARDLTPSIEDQRVFASRRPGDAEPIVVEIKADGQNRVELDLVSGPVK